MPISFVLPLTVAQTKELETLRDHAQKAYLRMKAAALLKVAQGHSLNQVAAHGLLKPVQAETVSRWAKRYQGEGVEGLKVQSGRGRKPAFSPCA